MINHNTLHFSLLCLPKMHFFILSEESVVLFNWEKELFPTVCSKQLWSSIILWKILICLGRSKTSSPLTIIYCVGFVEMDLQIFSWGKWRDIDAKIPKEIWSDFPFQVMLVDGFKGQKVQDVKKLIQKMMVDNVSSGWYYLRIYGKFHKTIVLSCF